MNSADITIITEFRRFVNSNIYQETVGMLMDRIVDAFNTDSISFESEPQTIIKFHSKHLDMYTGAKVINLFVNFFSDPVINNLIKSRIHTDVSDEKIKNYLRLALSEIQSRNYEYLALLYNIAILNDGNVYIYL